MAGPFELYEVLEGEYVELYGPLPANYPDANLPPDYPSPRDSREARLTAICNLIHKRARVIQSRAKYGAGLGNFQCCQRTARHEPVS